LPLEPQPTTGVASLPRIARRRTDLRRQPGARTRANVTVPWTVRAKRSPLRGCAGCAGTEMWGPLKIVFSGFPVREIRKIKVYCIDFHARRLRVNSRGEFTRITGLGAIICRHFDKSRFYRPKVRIANRQISSGSSAQRPGFRPTHVLHVTISSGSGPARKHTAKFEPAAWSWAQMTSGAGARKRVL
jgi:hypothetical protein